MYTKTITNFEYTHAQCPSIALSRLPPQLVHGVVVVESFEGVQSSRASQCPARGVGEGVNEFADSLMYESHGAPAPPLAEKNQNYHCHHCYVLIMFTINAPIGMFFLNVHHYFY